MNYYYVDPTISVGGNGTQQAPFKSLLDFLNLTTVTHPITVYIKSGSVQQGNFLDTNALFYNTTDSMSFIDVYGGTEPAVLLESDSTLNTLQVAKARKLTINNLSIRGTMQQTMVTIKPSNTSGTATSDVWLTNCKISGDPSVPPLIDKYAMYFSVNTDNGAVHTWGMINCHFDAIPRGVWAIGNGTLPSGQSYNIGDRFYSKGVLFQKVNITRCGADGIVFSNIASDLNPLLTANRNALTSRVNQCTYSGHRLDGQAQWSVAFWMSNCNKVLIDYTSVTSMWPSTTDRTAFDFDIYCWDCLIEYCYSSGNGGGLFITSNYAGQVTAKPSGTDNNTWYITNRYGNGNNTIRYCLSYNDGINYHKTLYQGFVYNLTIQNCTFIDTLSTSGQAVLAYTENNMFSQVAGVTGFTFDSCIFYYTNNSTFTQRTSYSNSGSEWLTMFKNCGFYSLAGTITVPTLIDSGGNVVNNPLFNSTPLSAPSTMEQGKVIKLKSTSPMISKGTSTIYPDIMGNAGSNIGWQQ